MSHRNIEAEDEREFFRQVYSHPSYLLTRHINFNSNLYHIILHKSEFHKFISQLNENIFILACSDFWKNEHVHLVVRYSKKKFNFSVNFIIPPIRIKDKIYVYLNFIWSSEEGHNLVCNASFNVLCLQTLSMNVILKNLNYLHNMEKLNLPTFLQKQLFERSQHYYALPDYSRQDFKMKDLSFPEDISIYKKDFVVWTQERKYRNVQGNDLILYNFQSDGVFYDYCFKCMKFMMGKRKFCKNSFFFTSSIAVKKFYIKRIESWCHSCKQVPLFYIHKNFNAHKYKFYENVKIDFYENGIIVKTYPRRSSRVKKIKS